MRRPHTRLFRRRSTRRPVAALALAASALITTTSASHAAGATYVALGDSYSAGEGVIPYLAGTNNLSNLCHRSAGSYPSLLSIAKGYTTDGFPKAGTFDLAACSGATTHDLYQPNFKYPEEGPQLDHLGTNTRLVTLTLGGNDLGFTNWAAACLNYAPTWFGLPGPPTNQPGTWGCTSNALLIKQTRLALDALAGASNDAVLRDGTPSAEDPTLGTPKLDVDGVSRMKIRSVISVLRSVHERAPLARIVLASYPLVLGTDKSRWTANSFDKVSGYECDVTPPTALTYDYLDATTGVGANQFGANAIAARYANIERTAVAQAVSEGMQATFVDPQPWFAGHANCDTQSVTTSGVPITNGKWINGISPTLSGSFHPNDRGHRYGYLPAFRQALGI